MRCDGCRVSTPFCFCAHLKTVETRTAVDVVMHSREKRLASNTAHLAARTMSNARVHVRGWIGKVFEGEEILRPEHRALYLFPSPGARPLEEALAEGDPRPIQLIVPDGSWSQAKKVQERERAFWRLPRVALGGLRSRYRLRRAPREGGLATYEAIAHAVAILEGPERAAPLFENFDLMVEQNLKSRGKLPHTRETRAPQL